MSAIYKPGVIQVVPTYDIGAPGITANVLHYLNTVAGPPTVADMTTMQTRFNNFWGAVWAGLANSNVHYKGCIITDMGSDTGLQIRNDSFTPVAGGQTGGALGDNTAVLISHKTGRRYRGGHGRTYLPGIAMGILNNDGRTVTDSFRTATDTALATLATQMGSLSTGSIAAPILVVWHKKEAGHINTTDNVLVSQTQTVLASQRRRLRKVARHRTHP